MTILQRRLQTADEHIALKLYDEATHELDRIHARLQESREVMARREVIARAHKRKK